MYTRSRLWLMLCLMVMGAPLRAQMQEPVKFAVEHKLTGEAELVVTFTGRIDAGWHVYGTDIGDDGPQRAELTVDHIKGAKAKGRLTARGKQHRQMDEMFGMELSFYEGSVAFEQRFTLTGGDYDIAGYLTYGACNDQNCIPPTTVDFAAKGTVKAKEEAKAEEPKAEAKAEEKAAPEAAEAVEEPVEVADSDTTAADAGIKPALPVREDAAPAATPESATAGHGLWAIFFMGFLGGLLALLTPCVWPIIPMTVSFFLKRSKDDKRRGIRDALTYGASIVVIYLLLGLLVTLCFGASALNDLSTNAFFNIAFFLMLLAFGASFLGGFEITLPASWSNALDKKSERTTGLVSIFLMAFTLVLVSFSCTGPIIGFLLVEIGTNGADKLGPAIGMLGFALALALPFSLFAMFPTWLKSTPKSGNWMNCIKVVLGLVEIAFSLKFLSVADLAYGWHLLDREVFLSLWIVLFALMGAYLIGWVRFPHDEDEYDEMGEVVVNHRTSVTRFFLALVAFAFALYMVPGLWGAPCKAVSAFCPPMTTQDFSLASGQTAQSAETTHFTDYDEGMAYARKHHRPIMLDFTGYGCVNCRKMEAAVFTDAEVQEMMTNRYVVITLYVDDKTALAEPETVTENGTERHLRTVGDRWSYLQRSRFEANAQPFYVLLNNDAQPLGPTRSYDEDVPAFRKWLTDGLEQYK